MGYKMRLFGQNSPPENNHMFPFLKSIIHLFASNLFCFGKINTINFLSQKILQFRDYTLQS